MLYQSNQIDVNAHTEHNNPVWVKYILVISERKNIYQNCSIPVPVVHNTIECDLEISLYSFVFFSL